MGAAAGQSRYARAGDVLWRRAGAAVIVLPVHGGDVVELGGSGAALWDVLAEPTTVEDAATLLAELFGADRSLVAADVAAALADLCRRDVVRRDGEDDGEDGHDEDGDT